jgi:hypothetical protein
MPLKKRFGLSVLKKMEKMRFGDMCHVFKAADCHHDEGHLSISVLSSRAS